MKIYKNKFLLSILVLAMVLSGLYYVKPAAGETVKTFSQATEIEEGAQYALVMGSITPTGMSSASYYMKDTPVSGTTTLMDYAVFDTSGANDDASLWTFERVNDGYAIKAVSVSDASKAYVNLSSSGLSLGAKQELSVTGSNGSFVIANGSYRLRFTNSGNGGSTPGFASGTNTNSSTWRLYKVTVTESNPTASPVPPPGGRSFEATTEILEGTDYALAMNGLIPTGYDEGAYYLKDEAVSSTVLGFAAFDALSSAVDDTSLWRFEKVNSGYAIRSAAISDDSVAYLNLGTTSAFMGAKQELSISLNNSAFTIQNGSQLLRFTNSGNDGNGGRIPGYTSGTNTASSTFVFYKVVVNGAAPTSTPDGGPPQKPTNDRNEYESTYIAETGEVPARTFAFVSDIHVDYGLQNREQQLRQGILTAASRIRAEEEADVIGVLGDVTSNNAGQGWSKTNYDRMITNLTGVLSGATESGRILMVSGNHDFVAGGTSWNSGDYSSIVETATGALSSSEYFNQDDDSDSGVANLTKNNANVSMKLAYHYVIEGVDFICINTPYSGGDNHGSYVLTQSTLDWVENKLNQIGNDKPVVVLSHYPLSDSRNVSKYMAEPYNSRLKNLLLSHKNAILVYGHDHGNVYVNEDTYERITPYASNGSVLNNRPSTCDSFVSSFVGSISYYNNDYNTNTSLGADEPWVVQALMVYVYSDRVTFQMKNYGSRTGTSRCPAPYTVYKDTGVTPRYQSPDQTARPTGTPTATPTVRPTATPTVRPTATPPASTATLKPVVLPEGATEFEQAYDIEDGAAYALVMGSITPTGLSSSSYYMSDKAVAGTTTLLDYAEFIAGTSKVEETPLWTFEAMDDGYAIRALGATDASKAYLNITSTGIALGAKQKLSVTLGDSIRIASGSNLLRFTNSGNGGSTPGFTSGTKEASSTWMLYKVVAAKPTPTPRPTRTPRPTAEPDIEPTEVPASPEPTVDPSNSTPGPGADKTPAPANATPTPPTGTSVATPGPGGTQTDASKLGLKVSGKKTITLKLKNKKKRSIVLKAKLLGIKGTVKWKVTKGKKNIKLNKKKGKKVRVTAKKKGKSTLKVKCGKYQVTKKFKIK